MTLTWTARTLPNKWSWPLRTQKYPAIGRTRADGNPLSRVNSGASLFVTNRLPQPVLHCLLPPRGPRKTSETTCPKSFPKQVNTSVSEEKSYSRSTKSESPSPPTDVVYSHLPDKPCLPGSQP